MYKQYREAVHHTLICRFESRGLLHRLMRHRRIYRRLSCYWSDTHWLCMRWAFQRLYKPALLGVFAASIENGDVYRSLVGHWFRNDQSRRRRIDQKSTTDAEPNTQRKPYIDLCFNQSIKTNLYSALRRRRIRGACWTRLGRVFTFAVRTIKQFSL